MQRISRRTCARAIMVASLGLPLLVMLGVTTGCDTGFTSGRDTLVGRWQATDRPWTIEFAAADVVRMSTIGPAQTGRYRREANGTLWIEMPGSRQFTTVVQVTGDQMTFTDPDGSFVVFKRISGL